tara:strand:+ start:1208 stop:2383 length:1176 start_codon:yes stop_codon:yes gene_type:complete
MLTQYDEFPVHQTGHPFTRASVSDYSFDDGYFFGVFSAEEDIFLYQGLRVNPNNNMIGGYAGVMTKGVQYTTRFKRPWQIDCDTRIGPYSVEFIEPFLEIHLALAENESALSFEIDWLATAPAFEEAHHSATSRGRVTTDQTRYTQAGKPRGWIEFKGRRLEVEPGGWWAGRDHSWGQYFERAPLAPGSQWKTPPEIPEVRRALRLWMIFSTPEISGFFGLHEDADGRQLVMNDMFGTPFEGLLARSPDDEGIGLVSAEHKLEFHGKTKVMQKGKVVLIDANGDHWQLEIEAAGKPWWPHTIGYAAGSWKDGGSMVSYSKTNEVQLEWDEFDWSEQPFDHEIYSGPKLKEIVGGESVCSVKLTFPDGSVSTGAAHLELFIDSPYRPYGFNE